jgi:hypothetical protein
MIGFSVVEVPLNLAIKGAVNRGRPGYPNTFESDEYSRMTVGWTGMGRNISILGWLRIIVFANLELFGRVSDDDGGNKCTCSSSPLGYGWFAKLTWGM